jgi:putative restriction endonuclease
MAIWWVSHNKTFESEIAGGYLWSPKTNSDDSYSRAYENMTKVSSGDLVVSFAGSEVRAVGIAEGVARTAVRPPEFGKAGEAWSAVGWLVPVSFSSLTTPFRPSDYMSRLAPLLPPKYSPLRANGHGNEAYLFDVSGLLGNEIIAIANELGEEIPAVDEAGEVAVRNRTDIPSTKKVQLIEARLGQGIYRANLERIEKKCRFTGISDRRFLTASHIKAWSLSTDVEKLDGHNGLLLAPHVDRLFDRGFIGFQDDGTVLRRHDLPAQVLVAFGIDNVHGVGGFLPAQLVYIQHHRDRHFPTG